MSCKRRAADHGFAALTRESAQTGHIDGEGHISADPHWLPREQALLLAHNQQLIWGSAAQVLVL